MGGLLYYITVVGSRVDEVAAALADRDATCPHCAELLKTTAEVCPHCGREVSLEKEEARQLVRRVCERSDELHVAAEYEGCPHCGEPVVDGQHPPLKEGASRAGE